MEKKFIKRQIFVMSVFVIGLIILALAGSYAIFSKTDVVGQKSVVRVGELELSYTDFTTTDSSIGLVSPYPISDEEALSASPYHFRIKNTGTLHANYVVKITEDEKKAEEDNCKGQQIDDQDIRVKIDEEAIVALNAKKRSGGGYEYIVSSGSLVPGGIKDHELRLWLAENSPNSNLGKHFHGKIQIEIEQTTGSDASKRPEIIYTDEVLHGADPVLSDNLVPVTIASDGTVRRADLNRKWYDYTNKEWANAVVLEDTAKEYQVEEVIPEEAIESYFVWIPRYRYTLFNTGDFRVLEKAEFVNKTQEILITFEDKNAVVSNGTQNGEEYSHPAFQAFDTNGFWVGKFESGYRDATSLDSAQVNSSTPENIEKLIIKSRSYSWRAISASNIFKVSYNYLRDYESHAMKNTEWGAVAYLSHSKYGKNGEVYLNNNSSYLTGCGGESNDAQGTENCTNAYGSNKNNQYPQSTTGNISGVFDMSGGGFEQVMGVFLSSADTLDSIRAFGTEFFSDSKWEKYYDKYTSDSSITYNNRILGDATGELGPFYTYSSIWNISSWYHTEAVFIEGDYPWVNRSGAWNTDSLPSLFHFSKTYGGGVEKVSFRVVLAP